MFYDGKYLKDKKYLRQELEFYMVEHARTEDTYYPIQSLIRELSYNDLVLFYCMIDNFTFEWAMDLLKETTFAKKIIDILDLKI